MFFNTSSRTRLASGMVLALALLSGCGGGGSDEPKPPVVVNEPPVTMMLLSGNLEAGTEGADASTSMGSEMILSGSSSSDANGDALTYLWSIVSKPATSTLALGSTSNVKQVVRADVPGTYVLNLRVTDSKGAFSEKKVTVLVRENVAPVTNVVVTATYTGLTTTAPTQALNVGSAVVLDAKGSKDADGDVVTTTWTMLEKPAGSTAGLTIDGAVSRFVADVGGVYKVRAHGIDPKGAYSETVYTFNADNSAPTAIVVASAISPAAAEGSKLTVAAGYTVSLENNSLDLNNYSVAKGVWSIKSKPAGSAAVLSSTDGKITQITTDAFGDYVVLLTATDTAGAVSSRLTTITVKNHGPIAHVLANVAPVATQSGPSVRLPLNMPVTLRGAGSTDADGDALTYSWTMSARPSGSTATLSSADGDSTQITADLAGSYTVVMRVTDAAGAFSEMSKTFQAGSYAPVAVIDKVFTTVMLGSAASASASMSFDEDSGGLSYSWAVDSAPAGSTATIAAPSAAALAFTPDVAGTYVISVTVSDGVNTGVAQITVKALASMVANVELGFVPYETRYSAGLDKLVILSINPNALKIVDPFSGAVKTVILPLAGTSLNVSADGKLAAVLHENLVSLVDLSTGTMIRSTMTSHNFSEALVLDSGVITLVGRASYTSSSSTGIAIIEGRTGADLTATHATLTYYGQLTNNYKGLFAAKKNRAFLSDQSGYYLANLGIDAATGKVSSSAQSYNETPGTLYLSDNQDLLFTSAGTMYRTDNATSAGRLLFTGTMQSLSHSTVQGETLVMSKTAGSYPDYAPTYSSVMKRYVGALFLPDTDLTLPLVGGLQSYGIQVYHSADGRQVVLVQTGAAGRFAAGVKYYILTR